MPVTAVPIDGSLVAWDTAPSQTHTFPAFAGAGCPSSHPGFRWSLPGTRSKPASSATTPWRDAGYAHVNTDVRGSGKSGGALCLLCKREQEDVYDVVEWIARQPWSNGKVALSGYSYSAITALLGAALRPPHLSAVIVGHPPTDPYRDVLWQNGLYNQG